MDSWKDLHEKKKCMRPFNCMSAVVKVSFFCPQNVGFLNSKSGRVADVSQTINWLQPKYIAKHLYMPLPLLT